MRNFQIILLGIFGFFIVAGVIAFATFKGGGGDVSVEPVTLWGTLPAEDVTVAIGAYNNDFGNTLLVTYRSIHPDFFDTELVEALAEGRGPDLVLLSDDRILMHEAKVRTIPFEAFPEREFKDQFIAAGEIFLVPGGTLAIPFAVDPMVMYWNRTHFANASLATPPETWDDIAPVVRRLTERDAEGGIVKSGVGLGSYTNILHAKEILTALLGQSGDSIAVRGVDGTPSIAFGSVRRAGETAAEAVLRFYTEFSNPARALYTWNRALPMSRTMFLSGDLSVYFGFASELFTLQEQNPNLNFDVAALPQIVGTERESTYARVYGLAITNATPKSGSALYAARIMSSPEFIAAWEQITGLPAVRRDVIAEGTPDAFRDVFRNSALVAEGFLDPNPAGTGAAFRTMVDDVTSGREGTGTAVLNAAAALRLLVQ